MTFFLIWIWLSIVTRLAVDRISLSGSIPYPATSSSQVALVISITSGFYTLIDTWCGPMTVWTLVYVLLWLVDQRSPADVWRLELERQRQRSEV